MLTYRAQHHLAATQLAVDLGLIRAGTLKFVPLHEAKNYTLSNKVIVLMRFTLTLAPVIILSTIIYSLSAPSRSPLEGGIIKRSWLATQPWVLSSPLTLGVNSIIPSLASLLISCPG